MSKRTSSTTKKGQWESDPNLASPSTMLASDLENLRPPPPDVTVLITAYNSEDTIGAAVNSAFNHAGLEIEVLVGNDASQDATGSVAERHGAVVHSYKKNNGTKGIVLKKLWPHATGRYVIVLDHDDTLETGCLTEMVEEFDRLITITDNTRYFLYGQTQYHGARNTLHRPPVFNSKAFYRHNPVCSLILVHRATILEDKIEYCDNPKVYPEDWLYMLFLLEAGYKGYAMQNTLVQHYNYRAPEDSAQRYKDSWPIMHALIGDKFELR